MDQKSITTQSSCVTINVHVKCDKCDKKNNYVPCNEPKKDDHDERCVDINVFVECDDQKNKD